MFQRGNVGPYPTVNSPTFPGSLVAQVYANRAATRTRLKGQARPAAMARWTTDAMRLLGGPPPTTVTS
jgi:hypothetical protein